MIARTVSSSEPGPRRTVWSRAGEGLVAAARGLGFFGLMLAGTVPLLALVLIAALAFEVLGGRHRPLDMSRLIFILVPLACTVPAVRWLARLTRRLAGRWCGVPISDPYLPRPGGGVTDSWQRVQRRIGWLLTDPATWRDVLWLAVDTCAGWVLAAAPAGLVLYGLTGVIWPALGVQVVHTPLTGGLPAAAAVPVGFGLAALGLWAAPQALRAYGELARLMLAPTRQAELTLRVRHLAQTRSESIDTGAAELRRIERDLHDGAQARLVAMGMTLDAAGHLIDDNPAAARALLAEARQNSAKALAELRDLVRGIHPPVLADRGLADAVRALAMDSRLRVNLTNDLTGRPPAPVESAAYFSVSELLANVAKHADADQAWIDIRHEHGLLRIGVTDDGRGGADPVRGTGLRGIERRLAAFDGVLAVSSPPGGPTVANMEIPCALSSPKTSSC
ncbi:MAG TPA: histidine kinase [Streptosporangiaceae bacterium]|nr:histidine kinase [Streptosporangiaceae bacterium]